jgi:SAM-dependent methyltransferase
MLANFRHNCPEAFTVGGIVQSGPFADCMFDAAVAWGVMFHLNPEDATRAIANVSRIVKRGAPFLFTSGDVDSFDGKEGKMNGVTFRYFSLFLLQRPQLPTYPRRSRLHIGRRSR